MVTALEGSSGPGLYSLDVRGPIAMAMPGDRAPHFAGELLGPSIRAGPEMCETHFRSSKFSTLTKLGRILGSQHSYGFAGWGRMLLILHDLVSVLSLGC